jgi:hypothetical protein
MYYIIYRSPSDLLCISQQQFETLDDAYVARAWFRPDSDARVVEEHKTISQRLVIKKKPEPVWRDLKTEDKPVLTGKERLGELLRAKLNGG